MTVADDRFRTAQQRAVRHAVTAVAAVWSRLDLADTAAWQRAARPELVAAISSGQASAASTGQTYVAATLAAAGAVSRPLGRLVASALAGTAAGGLSLGSLVDYAWAYFRRALELGAPPSDAADIGRAKLLIYTATEVADAGRVAVQIGGFLEPEVYGYERLVHLPACGRCIVLAGRLYRYSSGFLRHPRCDCGMKAVTRQQWRADGAATDPRSLFETMSKTQQDKAFGPGGAEAIRHGADISRVVNARRKGAVYVAGGHEFTHEATTTRGLGRQLGELRKRPGRRYRSSGVARPTPAQLVALVQDRDELLTQLRRFGYVR